MPPRSTTVTMSAAHRDWLISLQRQLAIDRGYAKDQAPVDEVMAYLEDIHARYITMIRTQYTEE